MNIQVVGDIILDRYIKGTATRLSPEAPVPVLSNFVTEHLAGGAANVALNLRALDNWVDLVGVVGRDAEADVLGGILVAQDVGHSLVVDEQAPTTVKTRIVADGQCLVRLDNERSHNSVAHQVLKVVTESTPDLVVLSDYNKGALAHASKIIAAYKQAGIRCLVDPKQPMENYTGAWLVKPNRKEFEQFVGPFNNMIELELQARAVMYSFSIDNMLVTLGADGMALVTPNDFVHLPTQAQEVYDITGAGDVVIAVVAHAVAQGLSLEHAVQLATQAAARAVAHHGNYIVQPTDIKTSKTVFTNGCFDILHPGHVQYLLASRALGDQLVVGLNSDTSVRKLKGSERPINNQDYRKAMLEALSCVDQVIIFDEETPEKLIRNLRPDVITKGGDYTKETVVGYDLVPETVILPLLEGHSTTNIITRIQNDQT